MLDDELAASKLNLHFSNEPVTVAEGWGQGACVESLQRSNKHPAVHEIFSYTSSLPGLYLSSCKADKKGPLLFNRKICIATGRQRDWTLTQYRGRVTQHRTSLDRWLAHDGQLFYTQSYFSRGLDFWMSKEFDMTGLIHWSSRPSVVRSLVLAWSPSIWQCEWVPFCSSRNHPLLVKLIIS